MIGDGHPSDGNCRSTLCWKLSFSDPTYQSDARNNTHLMTVGGPFDADNPREQLIKKEWDLIEAWLKKLEDDGKL
jgi:hypothetical protein